MSIPACCPWPISGLLLLLYITNTVAFELVSPILHTALTGDIEVMVTSWTEVNWSSLSLAVRLVSVDADMATLTSAPVLDRRAVFRCGAIYIAGRFCFQLIDLHKVSSDGNVDDADDDAVLVESRLMNVRWPHVRIELPDTMETYTADISARVHVQGVVCYPPRPRLDTWLELAFYGSSMARGPLNTRFLQRLKDFYSIGQLDINLHCKLLDQPGFYQVVLRSNRGSPSLVGSSTGMRVVWSDAYWLRAAPPTVFPCASVVAVTVRYPRCILNDDRVRLFGRPPLNVSAWVEGDHYLEYVAEERVVAGTERLLFACPSFPPRYETFCFKYVSTAHNGAVADLRLHCIPAHAHEGVSLNGNWGQWSPWTPCSVTCGQGTRNRYRFCDSPPPSKGRSFCPGSALRVETCQRNLCPVAPSTLSPVLLVPVSDSCLCGCKMNVSGSAVVSSSRLHCNRSAVWTLEVRRDHRLEITFKYVRLDVEKEWVIVRDGQFLSSPMLAFVTGGSLPSSPTRSTHHLVLLEFQPLSENLFDKSLPTGFIAQVQEITEKGLAVLVASTWQRRGFTGTAAHWTAIALCLVALVSAIALAVLHALRRAKWHKVQGGRSRQNSTGSVASQLEYHQCPYPITTTTSISDMSFSRFYRNQRRRKKKRKKKFISRRKPLSPVSSDGGTSSYVRVQENPEDVMEDVVNHLWGEESPPRKGGRKKKPPPLVEESAPTSPSLKSPPLARRPNRQVALDVPPASRQLPVATVSPQPQRPPTDRVTSPAGYNKKGKEESSSKARHLKGRTKEKGAAPPPTTKKRSHLNSDVEGSSPALVGSTSEMSFAGTDIAPDLEYDYYDYDVHDEPGSFFCADSEFLSWLPPFLPTPPSWGEPMMPLAEFSATLGIKPPPTDIVRNHQKSEEQLQVSESSSVVQRSKGQSEGFESPSPPEGKSSSSVMSPAELDGIAFADASDPDSPKKQAMGKKASEGVKR